MESPSFINVSDLVKTYGFGRVRALDGITLDIQAGEIFGLIGSNGAGKTTLMGCLLGLLWPSGGKIAIDGRSPSDLEIKRVTGFLPERPSFDKWMKVSQFLSYHYMLSGQPLNGRKSAITAALEMVKLDKTVWQRQIRTLSRGMLQRVGLAQILIIKPKLCFLDEPTSGMDPIGMSIVRDILLQWKAGGVTIVLNSHHLHEVENICDRVAYIQRGKIQSIESLSTPQGASLFVVRWQEGDGVDATTIFEELVRGNAISLSELSSDSAKIVLGNEKEAAALIRTLVSRGLPICEATFQKRTLLDLFIESGVTS